MFATLLESGTTTRQRPGTVSLSLVLHIALIIGALALAPRRPTTVIDGDLPQTLVYVDPIVKAEYRKLPNGGAGGLPTSQLPEIDLLPGITGIDPDVPLDISGVGTDAVSDIGGAGGTASSDPGATGQGIYTLAAVERPAIALPGNRAPSYPDMLRAAGIEGSVLVQFVIDTTGSLEPGSVRVVKSDHDLLSLAVRNALTAHRFLPAEVGGRKVRMLVQQRFDFAIEK